MNRHDLAIVGGGTAGLVAAVGAAGVGARVCLIERERTGGDCLWRGCVPSKSLLAAAQRAHDMRTADTFGITGVEPEVDFARVMAHVKSAQDAIAPHDSPERLRREGVEVIHGDARFVAPGRLEVDGRPLAFRSAFIATGSQPSVPPIPGLAEAEPLTSDNLWDLTELPRRLVVLGGGPIGCELGQAFRRLGSQVTIVEMMDSLLTTEEAEAGRLLIRHLTDEGVDIRLATRGVEVRSGDDGRVLAVEGPDGTDEIAFDHILVATGRTPRTDGLGLAAVGVDTDGRGAIVVDDTLRTSADGIFAGGDVTGGLAFTHVAGQHGSTVVTNALFATRRKVSTGRIPIVIYTDPEIARVGLTSADARSRWGGEAAVRTFQHDAVDRAVTAGRTEGFSRLIGDPKGGLVGATVIGPVAGESIAEVVAWMHGDGKLTSVAGSVHAYPTFSEGPAKVASEVLREAWLGPRTRRLTVPVLWLVRLVHRLRRTIADR